MPRTRQPQLEQFEDRLLLSISPSITGADTIDEGTPYELALSSAGDAVARWDIDWGEGTTTTGTYADWGDDIAQNKDGTWTATHVYADDLTAQVTATAYDDIDTEKSLASSVSSVVTVEDTEPVLSISKSEPLKGGKTYVITLSSEDLGTDKIDSWTIDWGDGQVSKGSLPEFEQISYEEYQEKVAALNEAWLDTIDPSEVDGLTKDGFTFDELGPEAWFDWDDGLSYETDSQAREEASHDWGNGIIQITDDLWVVAHTYASDGSYKVKAIATDENISVPPKSISGPLLPTTELSATTAENSSLLAAEDTELAQQAGYETDLTIDVGLGGMVMCLMSSGTSAVMTLDGDTTLDEGGTYSLTIDVSNLDTDEEVGTIEVDWDDGTTSTGTKPASGNDWG